jgi:hypothetical protein
MSLQILILKLDGITAGDYLTWCHDPEPPALDYGLRSIRVNADPLGSTITAVLDWSQPAPAPAAAATGAGFPLSPGVQLHQLAGTSLPRTHDRARCAREFERDRGSKILHNVRHTSHHVPSAASNFSGSCR